MPQHTASNHDEKIGLSVSRWLIQTMIVADRYFDYLAESCKLDPWHVEKYGDFIRDLTRSLDRLNADTLTFAFGYHSDVLEPLVVVLSKEHLDGYTEVLDDLSGYQLGLGRPFDDVRDSLSESVVRHP